MLSTRLPFILAACTAVVATTLTFAPTASASTVWDLVAACESSGNWAISTGNGFYGGVQFTHSTWIAFGGGAYASDANGATKAQQILIAQRVLASQGPGAWPVCGPRAGLSRSNGAGVITVSHDYTRKPIVIKRRFLVVDGIFGPLTRAQANRHGIWFNTKPAIRAWQSRLRVPIDGVAGPVTVRALQRWLNTHN